MPTELEQLATDRIEIYNLRRAGGCGKFGAEQIEQRRVWTGLVFWKRASLQQQEMAITGVARDVGGKARCAHPGFADEQGNVSMAAVCRIDQVVNRGTLRGATRQHRTANRCAGCRVHCMASHGRVAIPV